MTYYHRKKEERLAAAAAASAEAEIDKENKLKKEHLSENNASKYEVEENKEIIDDENMKKVEHMTSISKKLMVSIKLPMSK